MKAYQTKNGVFVRNLKRFEPIAQTPVINYEAMDPHGFWFPLDTRSQPHVFDRPVHFLPLLPELEEIYRRQEKEQVAPFKYAYRLYETVEPGPEKLLIPIAGGNVSYPQALATVKHKLILNYPKVVTGHIWNSTLNLRITRVVYDGTHLVVDEYLPRLEYTDQFPEGDDGE